MTPHLEQPISVPEPQTSQLSPTPSAMGTEDATAFLFPNGSPRSPSSIPSQGLLTLPDVLTLEQLVQICVRLQPTEAAAQGDSALCVTPLITQLMVDGKLIELRLKAGRWAAGYPRVSGLIQRAAESAETKKTKKAQRRQSTQQVVDGANGSGRSGRDRAVADGYSEEEQLTRQIRHFIHEKIAFKIYSDCGVTGEYPTNDPRLIRRLLNGKATRYRKIYERTLLDETSIQRRSPEEIASMHAYLEKRVARIQSGLWGDDLFGEDDRETSKLSFDNKPAENSSKEPDNFDEQSSYQGPGRPRNRVYFRQGLTQLWRDIEAGFVHTVAVSDRSRLCRSADLESEFLVLLNQHATRLVGLIEDLSTLDVSDPLKKGFAYMIASINEYRLEEVAGHSFRGILQLLESGHPHGRPPWWLARNEDGKAVEVPEYACYARRVAELYLSGLGVAAIITALHAENVRVGGEPLTARMIRFVLESDAVSGRHWQFGLAWDVYPRLLPEETVQEIQERRLERRDILIPNFGARVPGRTAANHEFTGLLRCSCGRQMSYSHPSRNLRLAGHVGYYYCPAPHKRAAGAPVHAWMNEDKISAFVREVLDENPHLIANALSAGDEKTALSAAQRALLEERLRLAREEFRHKEAEARTKAVQTALAAGIGEQSSIFASVVSELSRELLETDSEVVLSLESELAHLCARAGQDRQIARILAAVEDLRGKKNATLTMDARTRNGLLKAVFEEITVHPLSSKLKKREAYAGKGPGAEDPLPSGCLVIRLAGVGVLLPPVRMRRGIGKEMRLPTIGQWLTDVFALAPFEDETMYMPSPRVRRTFSRVLKEVQEETPVGRLAACICSDLNFPRRCRGRASAEAYMAENDLYKDVRQYLDAAWTHYRISEWERLRAAEATAITAGTKTIRN